jgi:DNA helicase-2/ATP-dependent DNA helicase PcrA
VDIVFDESVLEEAESTALWLKRELATIKGSDDGPPTAAMLFRARKTQQFFLDALRKHDVPYHVLGVGGLLATAEIADLVSALTVVSNPTAGNELIRLLAGSRWRIGVRDLRFLRRLASWLNKRDLAQQPLADEVVQRLRNSVAEGEGGSIVDALDFLATAPVGHSQLADFSDLGIERLRDAGRMFAWLRSRAGLDLLDFVTLVEQELRLDIEVVANEHLPLGGANKEAFFDALAGYIAVDESASLGGFLGWLREAEWRDGLSPRPEDPEPGTVQILTIHGAKGLEWDAVVVPRLVDEELPAKPREGYNGWLAFGQLPWVFRGDRNELPEFVWQGHDNRKQLLDARAAFTLLVRERHEFEERRLVYVAVTRARHALLLSGSYWATQTKPRGPSPFLVELSDSGVIGALPSGTQYDGNPLGDEVDVIFWPTDPLGGRRARVEAAAAAVRAADPGDAGVWASELELLLAERAARLDSGRYVALPSRVPASRFKDFLTDPASVAAGLRRPMPEKPYRATRLGTLFHSWVEERGGVGGSFEELDTLASESDVETDQLDVAALAGLQATFEKSKWASLKPVDVEREIHLVLDGQIIICKIDAVYAAARMDAGEQRYEIVDWKTGKAPKDARDLEEKQFQLALYRLAYAQWRGIDPGLIDAVFYYVADDRVIRPERLFDEAELVARWRESLPTDRGADAAS